ncbi:acyltransferase family protein [Pseudonocardia abyssalis]|uniref:Acyltransferase n=1 Tax=Pseudonocardia abyssalis TaxID=2792008 RepID=A0ABS6UV86_9PSEU|nr:acyltransferase [Pseudonocardia abyssalis]MBW0116880.1 acyltransferase [Pseudonocardia abyssalis]MBW0135748.1 acyltransferase [Pseudonocardia abyssalis]
MSSTPQFGTVQALRAVAVLLVVGAHLGGPTGFEDKLFGSPALLGWTEHAGPMGVDLFFVVSGFIMAVTTRRLASGVQPASAFLLRRVTRIYPCYLLVTAAILAVFLWRPEMVNSSEDVRPDVLASFLLLPQEGLPLLLVGWTLVYEMLFYVVLAVTLLVRRSWLWGVLGAWVVLIVALSPLEDASSNVWVGLLLSPRNLEFVLGVALAAVVLAGRLVAPSLLCAAGVALLTVAAVLGPDGGPAEGWLRLATIGLPMTVLVYGVVGGELRYGWSAPRSLVATGDASYSLYLVHVPVLKVLGIGLGIVVAEAGLLLRSVLLVVVAAGTVAAGLLFHRWAEKPLITLLHDQAPRPRRAERIAVPAPRAGAHRAASAAGDRHRAGVLAEPEVRGRT